MSIHPQVLADLKNINWNAVFRLIDHLGNQFDARSLRSIKGRFIELAITRNSNGKFLLESETADGYDLRHITTNTLISVKFQRGSLITPRRRTWKSTCGTITINNHLSTGLEQQYRRVNFDYLLIVDLSAAAVIGRDGTESFLVKGNDSNKLKACPIACLTIVNEQRHRTAAAPRPEIGEGLLSLMSNAVNYAARDSHV